MPPFTDIPESPPAAPPYVVLSAVAVWFCSVVLCGFTGGAVVAVGWWTFRILAGTH